MLSMNRDGLMLVLVPGRDDRAFYKRFFRYTANRLNLHFDDLDASNRGVEKRTVLDRVCKQARTPSGGEALCGASVLRLSSKDSGRSLEVVVLPTERRVTHVASLVLEYQAGLDKPTIDFVVVADDAEEMSSSDRLDSLYNSLISAGSIEIDRELKRGNYFRSFILKKPKGIRLLLLVQGIETVTGFAKHAIEDYVLYLHMDTLAELRKYRSSTTVTRIRN